MTAGTLLLGSLLAALCSGLTIALRLKLTGAGLDTPNERSLHTRPTPHGGGMGIVLCALLGGLWLALPPALLGGLLALSALSALDDWRPLPFWLRLPPHLAMAAWAASTLAPATLPGAVLVLATLTIAWSTNAYNFMDGADGLAGCMTVCGFSAYSIGFYLAGQTTLAAWSLFIVAAALAFLAFNWHPAKIFMGDVGAIPLGFIAGSLGWLGVAHDSWPVWFPVLAFAPFLGDATLTLLRRARAGQRVWQAHREHLYQRMVAGGLSHAQMSRRWLGVMAAGALLAVVLQALPPAAGWFGALAWLAGLALLRMRLLERLEGKTSP